MKMDTEAERAAAKARADQEWRTQALLVASGVAAHALICSGQCDPPSLIARAFDLGERFVAEAERRLGRIANGQP